MLRSELVVNVVAEVVVGVRRVMSEWLVSSEPLKRRKPLLVRQRHYRVYDYVVVRSYDVHVHLVHGVELARLHSRAKAALEKDLTMSLKY